LRAPFSIQLAAEACKADGNSWPSEAPRKLMGNGHLGDRGTIAPEVIEAFGKRIRHFNTFGGNPGVLRGGPCGSEGHQGRPAAGADRRDGK